MSEICYACGEEIVERIPPKDLARLISTPQKIGKYTIRRQAWDENWKEITEDTFYHESCYYRGFVSAIRYGLIAAKMFDETDAKEMINTAKEKGLPE